MNGVHDTGGQTCFGPIIRESDEPVFHADWERRVFAMMFLHRNVPLEWSPVSRHQWQTSPSPALSLGNIQHHHNVSTFCVNLHVSVCPPIPCSKGLSCVA